MSKTLNFGLLSIFAGALVGVVVGLSTQITLHLWLYGDDASNPFRFLLDYVTTPLLLALLGLVISLFALQIIRRRKSSNSGPPQPIRWFSMGAILTGVLGELIVNLIVALRRTFLEHTYVELMFIVSGIIPSIISLVMLPLGLLAAKTIDQL